MAPYKLELMTPQLDTLLKGEMEKAIRHWKEALTVVQEAVVPFVPKHWKARVLDNADESYIKIKILTQSLVDSLGSDYLPACNWVAALKTLEIVEKAFETHHPGFLKTAGDVVQDARALVACVLGYNVPYNRYFKQSATERRQSLKDLKNKTKSQVRP